MQGIAIMLVAIDLLSSMDALAKSLMLGGISAIQILGLRSLIIIR